MDLFTKEQRDLLIKLLEQITINPMAVDAGKIVELVQSTAKKVDELTEKDV